MNKEDEGAGEGGPVEGGPVEGGPVESGTARARRILIAPLACLARPAKVAEAQHRDNLDRLARKLSYMDAPGLAALAEIALAQAGQCAKGRALPVCPLDGVVLAWAYALQPPPVQQSDYAASVMRSVMGRQAYDRGYGVELLRHARRHGPPPGAYSVVKLKDEARENGRRRAALRVEIEAGNSLPPERARWLDAWHADALMVAQLIAEGDERREARAGAA